MTPQQVSQFISTYGLPPPPNKYSPRRARLPGMQSDSYNAIGSIMSTPRGMRIGRRQESLGPDIEGGDYDDELIPQRLESIPESPSTAKKSKRSSRKKVAIALEDESDPDLQLV